MEILERRVLAELRKVREAEAALENMYRGLRNGSSDHARSFMASLNRLDERVNHLESLLEGVA